MVNETNLRDLIERERRYIDKLNIGSDDYVNSMKRLMELEKLLSEIENNEAEVKLAQKSRRMGDGIEIGKVATSVLVSMFGLFYIVAQEREMTFTGAMRDITKCFLPKIKI